MQRFSHTSSILLSIASLTLSTTALAQHADVWVSSANGSLYTGGWDDVTGEVINPVQRVFEGELGLDPVFPFSGDEPGIGSDLVGLSLTMNLIQGLSAWNGTDFVTSTYSLGASYGGQDAFTTSGGSFSFLVSSALDLHPAYTLYGANGADPLNGIYLATFTFSAAGYETSAPLWAVLNFGMSEEDHGAAVAWAETNLVPAPAAFAMFALGGLLGRRQR